MRVKAITIRTMVRTISHLTAFASEPKMMGRGPIMTTPPPLALPSRNERKAMSMVAMRVIAAPRMVRARPRVKRS